MKTNHIIALIARIRNRAIAFLIRELNQRNISGLVPSHGAIRSNLFKRDKAPFAFSGFTQKHKEQTAEMMEKILNNFDMK